MCHMYWQIKQSTGGLFFVFDYLLLAFSGEYLQTFIIFTVVKLSVSFILLGHSKLMIALFFQKYCKLGPDSVYTQ